MKLLGPFLLFLSLCVVVAYFLGRKRHIGFGWSLFFSLFFSPIIGFLVTMLSPKYYDPNPEPSKTKRVFGWLIVVLFGVGLFVSPIAVGMEEGLAGGMRMFFVGVGMVGVGAYLIGRGRGNSYSSTDLVADSSETEPE